MATALVFMTGRNCRSYLEASIGSIALQQGVDLHLLFVDDASTDGTGEEAERLLNALLPERHTLVRRTERCGKARNAFEQLPRAPARDFVAVVDADDMLIDAQALATLAASYDEGCDVVWTNHVTDKGGRGTNRPLDPFVSPRTQGFRTSHLFSFRKELFLRVPEAYFRDDKGDWYQSACDYAIAFPVLDQTRRYRYIPRDCLVYTTTNPQSHHNSKKLIAGTFSSEEQRQNAIGVVAKPPLPCWRPLAEVPVLLSEALEQRFSEWGDERAALSRRIERLERRASREAVQAPDVQKLLRAFKLGPELLAGCGGWSLEPSFLAYLGGVLGSYRQPRVLLMGGVDAIPLLSRMVAATGGKLTATSEDAAALWRIRQEAGSNGAGPATLVSSQLRSLEFVGMPASALDLGWLAPDEGFDIAIVDGPAGRPGSLAKLGALPAVADRMADRFHLFVTDFDRADERRVVEMWQLAAPDLRLKRLSWNAEYAELTQKS